jgi:hypothetical protein
VNLKCGDSARFRNSLFAFNQPIKQAGEAHAVMEYQRSCINSIGVKQCCEPWELWGPEIFEGRSSASSLMLDVNLMLSCWFFILLRSQARVACLANRRPHPSMIWSNSRTRVSSVYLVPPKAEGQTLATNCWHACRDGCNICRSAIHVCISTRKSILERWSSTCLLKSDGMVTGGVPYGLCMSISEMTRCSKKGISNIRAYSASI